jgi:acetolactate synthase-1/2/3 large subunit
MNSAAVIGKNSLSSGAEFIAKAFKGYGITHVFYMEAILRRTLVEMEKLDIKRILAHSEKAAAYMADGYARASRRPGICMAQSVGAANLAAGLQDPYLGFSPVIAITGRKSPLSQYRHAYQEIQHNVMFDPVTKYNAKVDTIEQLSFLLRQAFREATSGAPGPVHLDFAGYEGELIEKDNAKLEVFVDERYTRYPSSRSEPEKEYLHKASQLLSKAEKPVIVAGGGARASFAGPEIIELAEMLKIPVATSLGAKGIIPDNHPLSLGVVGSYCRWCANQIVSEADLVLFIGSGTGDQTTNSWKVPPLGTSVIQIDINPAELGRNYPNIVGLMGDAKITCRRILELIQSKARNNQWTSRVSQVVKKWRIENEPLRNSDSFPILPERLCKDLTDVLPSNAILVVDTGFSGIWAGTMIDIIHSSQTFLRAAGSLGWAFPASLGAKCAFPNRPVVCFTGDGGLMYHISELETAARWGIKIVIVVNNNHCLAQCIRGINLAYGKQIGKKGDMYIFKELNYANIAQEMGCLGIRVERSGEIKPALETALKADQPVLVDVVTERDHMASWPPPDF